MSGRFTDKVAVVTGGNSGHRARHGQGVHAKAHEWPSPGAVTAPWRPPRRSSGPTPS
jgi:hypothetical protein